jgi:transcription termination factor NusB
MESPASTRAESRGEVFTRDDVRAYIARNAQQLAKAAEGARSKQPELASRVEEIRTKLEELQALVEAGAPDLEDLERRFTILEDKLHSLAAAHASEDSLLTIRRELDRQLSPYRRKMTAEQLAQVERQYLQKRLFELFAFPRLSLFYLT